MWLTLRLARRWPPQPPASPAERFSGRPVRPSARTRRAAVSAASVAVLSALVTAAAPAGASVRAGVPAPSAFQAAIQQIVNDGVPGAIGLARHGSQVTVATSGLADVATQTPMAAGAAPVTSADSTATMAADTATMRVRALSLIGRPVNRPAGDAGGRGERRRAGPMMCHKQLAILCLLP